MQHIASSTLSWSARHQVYELSDAKRREVLRLTSENPAWFAWLDEVSSFAFHGQSGLSRPARKPSSAELRTGTPIANAKAILEYLAECSHPDVPVPNADCGTFDAQIFQPWSLNERNTKHV